MTRLRTVPILAGLADNELACLTDAAQVNLQAGDYIARQGDAANYFWILLSGEMRVSHRLPDGHEQVVASVPAGTALGEMPLLANIPNGASIQCSEKCELLRFDEQQFWNLMTACPGVRKSVLGNMANRFQKEFQRICRPWAR